MAHLSFTSNLERHLKCPAAEVPGSSVSEVLGNYFVDHEGVAAYVLNDQGEIRHHVVVYLDGEAIKDRVKQSDAVQDNSQIYVFQALSGG